MFGIVRPCRHGMCTALFKDWMAHLCGLCLTLRAEHGQAARLVTNYDGLLVSVLVEAQNPGRSPHRKAGPCALRGMRGAEVVDARAEGARLAAAVSLLLAAGKTRDHLADGDGLYGRRLIAATAGRMADRWDAAGAATGGAVGFDPETLRPAVARQGALEAAPAPQLLDLTEPAETAVAAAFAHTALLAGRAHNADSLAEAGRYFGRLAHLLDAVQDLEDDRAAGAFNPLTATGTDLVEARRHCDGALHGLRLAVADLDLERRGLVTALLDRAVGRSVDEIFAGYPSPPGPGGYPGQPGHGGYPGQPGDGGPYGPAGPGWGHPQPPGPPPGGGGFGPGGSEPPGGHFGKPGKPGRPGFPLPCFTFTLTCCTCGLYQPEWSKRHGRPWGKRCWCRHCDCDCDCPCDACCCDC